MNLLVKQKKYYKVYSPRVAWNGDVGLNTVIRGFFVINYTEPADRIKVFAQRLYVFLFSVSPGNQFFEIYSTTLERISYIFGDISISL